MSEMPVGPFNWCANCVYWLGQRTPEAFFHRFLVDTAAKGICCRGGMNRGPMPMNATCNYFELHPICKK